MEAGVLLMGTEGLHQMIELILFAKEQQIIALNFICRQLGIVGNIFEDSSSWEVKKTSVFKYKLSDGFIKYIYI